MTDYKKGKGKGEGVSSERGIALIAAVLVVVILMAIGLSFAFNMRLEEKAAVNYMNSVKANQIAQAGIDRAIAALKIYANRRAYSNPADNWYYIDTTRPSFDGDDGILGNSVSGRLDIGGLRATYTLKVIDTASQIYLNDARDGGLGPGGTTLDEMLEALPGIGPAISDAIITHRNTWPGDIFITKEQVRGTPGIGPGIYNDLRDFITVNTWVNLATGRAPVNVNTASREVLIGVLDPLPDVTLGEAGAVADRIRANRPIRTWAEFNALIDGAVPPGIISVTDATNIRNNANPNRPKPSPNTTEFSFNSGGYFEIESTGRVFDLAGRLAAERKIRAVVNIFDIWHQTTRTQFAANTLRAVDAATRFYRVDPVNYYNAAQLAHLLVETEETAYPDFNFTIITPPWENIPTGGFNANPFRAPSPRYQRGRRPFGLPLPPSPTCQWNFAITEGLSGGTYDVFGWWYLGITNSPAVLYELQVGGRRLYAVRSQWWLYLPRPWWWLPGWPWFPPPPLPGWNRLESLDIPLATTASIAIIATFPLLRTIADAMLLAAVNAPGEDFAGTMTANFSPTLSPGENIQLGTIAWTEAFVNPAVGTAITFDVGIAPPPWPPSGQRGTHINPAGNRLSGTGTTISYRAYFSRTAELETPADPPILDDVTITYLPRTRILYWREVTE